MTTVEITRKAQDIDVYPPFGTDAEEPSSFWSRFKKSVANMMAKMLCGVTERPYNFFFKEEAFNKETAYITCSIELQPV